ncbi:MAG TPA: hypothetical protein VK648_08385 [Gemmatimonadaceae bacterium]|nr:MAG: hypothetical protein DMF56_24955 [Acidobacteriota bacterium]HTD83791.1 hypothetical protein [Gemmatimonadaceae bacterium]
MRKRAKAILLAALASIVSCSGYFMATYDPAVDGGATELQQKIDRFLTDLQQRAGTPAAAFDQHAAFYDDVRGDIQELRDLASRQRGNELTLQSLDLIENNVDKLEALHADGISVQEIDVVRTLFDTQFRMLVQLENAKKRKES